VNGWCENAIARHAGERFTLSLEERVGVRANFGLTDSGNARRGLGKKSGRKVVTSENYLALTQAAKKTKRLK
jgi:hypothetical protein